MRLFFSCTFHLPPPHLLGKAVFETLGHFWAGQKIKLAGKVVDSFVITLRKDAPKDAVHFGSQYANWFQMFALNCFLRMGVQLCMVCLFPCSYWCHSFFTSVCPYFLVIVRRDESTHTAEQMIAYKTQE